MVQKDFCQGDDRWQVNNAWQKRVQEELFWNDLIGSGEER